MQPNGLMAAGLLALLLASPPAAAQQARSTVGPQTCNSHGDLVDILRRTYAEEPNALGLQGNGHLLEVFVSKKTGSWTIVSTQPDGTSCIVAAGQYWRVLPDPAGEPVV